MTGSERVLTLSDLLTAHAEHTQTLPPEELIQAVSRLGLDANYRCGHATSDYDHEAGVSNWRVTLATEAVLIEITATAARVTEPYRNGEKHSTEWSAQVSNTRGPKMYKQPPKVTVRIRQLKNLTELNVVATGAMDSYERPEMVRETWTFTFRDGTVPMVFDIDHSDSERPVAVDELCRHLAACL